MTQSASWLDEFFRNEVTPPLINNGTGALPNVNTFDNSGDDVSSIRFTGVAADISGLIGGTPGRRIHIIAEGGPVVIEEESSSSLVPNRIKTGGGGNITIPHGSAA